MRSERLEKSIASAINLLKAKGADAFEVYSIGKTGKKHTHIAYDEPSEANEHVKQLRKLYGKHIQAGVEKKKKSRFQKVKDSANKVIQERRS